MWVHLDDLCRFEVNGETIVVTEDHPFWSVTDQTWEGPEGLAVGEVLLTAGGDRITVTSPLDWAAHRVDSAYNLTVEGLHTYHVADGEVLVHNDDDSPVGTVFHHVER